MSTRLDSCHQRVAEKFIIFNEHIHGLQCRLHYLHKASLEGRWDVAAITSDRKLEPLLKSIKKRFPSLEKIDIKPLSAVKQIVLKALTPYYNTIVDLLEFRDHVYDFLHILDALHFRFCCHYNSDLLINYCRLIHGMLCCCLQFHVLKDKRVIIGTYGACNHPLRDPTFARVCQMVTVYQHPLARLVDDFSPHHQLIASALSCLAEQYQSNAVASELIGIIEHPLVLHPAQELAKWFLSMSLVCPNAVSQSSLGIDVCTHDIGLAVAEIGRIPVFRGDSQDVSELVESNELLKEGHRSRLLDLIMAQDRRFKSSGRPVQKTHDSLSKLVEEMSQMYHKLRENQYQCGPMARDVIVLLRNGREKSNWIALQADDWSTVADLHVPLYRLVCELIYYMEEIKAIMNKHKGIIERYHIDFLSTYDSIEFHLSLKEVDDVSREEGKVIQMFTQMLKQFAEHKDDLGKIRAFKLDGVRVDWMRFQALISGRLKRSRTSIGRRFIVAMHNIAFHSDVLRGLPSLFHTADTTALSLLFKPSLLERVFRSAIELPGKSSVCIGCAMLCCRVDEALDRTCPEEADDLCETMMEYAHTFLCEICKEIRNLFFLNMRDDISNRDSSLSSSTDSSPVVESFDSFLSKNIDRFVFAMRQLCRPFAIRDNSLSCQQHRFEGVNYLARQLKARLNRSLFTTMQMDSRYAEQPSGQPCKPSTVQHIIEVFLDHLQILGDFASIDCARFCIDFFASKPNDECDDFNSCANYIRKAYINWYGHTMVLMAVDCPLIYTRQKRAFVVNPHCLDRPRFDPQEFTSPTELEALVKILGLSGILCLTRQLDVLVSFAFKTILRIAEQNSDLIAASQFESHAMMQWLHTFRECQRGGQVTEEFAMLSTVVQHMTSAGIALHLKELIEESRTKVCSKQLPFIQNVCELTTLPQDIADLIGKASQCYTQTPDHPLHSDQHLDTEERTQYVRMILSIVALFIPAWMEYRGATFVKALTAHEHNVHCIPAAVDALTRSVNDPQVTQRLQMIFLKVAAFAIVHYPFGKQSTFYSGLIWLDKLVDECRCMKHGMLEPMIPRGLIIAAYLYFENDKSS